MTPESFDILRSIYLSELSKPKNRVTAIKTASKDLIRMKQFRSEMDGILKMISESDLVDDDVRIRAIGIRDEILDKAAVSTESDPDIVDPNAAAKSLMEEYGVK